MASAHNTIFSYYYITALLRYYIATNKCKYTYKFNEKLLYIYIRESIYACMSRHTCIHSLCAAGKRKVERKKNRHSTEKNGVVLHAYIAINAHMSDDERRVPLWMLLVLSESLYILLLLWMIELYMCMRTARGQYNTHAPIWHYLYIGIMGILL